MLKRIIGFVVAITLGLGAFGLGSCAENLESYKAVKMTELQDYADSKGRDNYSPDNWDIFCNAVTDGNQAIEGATSRSDVDKAFNDAKAAVDRAYRDIELERYKEIWKDLIDAYFASKVQGDYSEGNWKAILQIVEDGKIAVDAATGKYGVDTAVEMTKQEIEAVQIDYVLGAFYSLDTAFEEGWLTTEELSSIAYYYYEETIYHDHDADEPYAPIPKNPSTLSRKNQESIKQTYLRDLKSHLAPDATLANIWIGAYFGAYNDCIAVSISDNCFGYDYLFEPEHYIGGVLFRNYCAHFAQIWKAM